MTTTRKSRKELPVEVPLIMVIGDDFKSPVFKHKNPDGTAINLTGQIITAQARAERKETSTKYFDFTVVRNDAAGEYYLTVDKAVVSAALVGVDDVLIAETIYFSIPKTDTLGARLTYFAGPIYIKREATA